MEVAWTQHALDALEEVYTYGRRFNQEQSINYTSALIEFCDRLNEFPFKYPACPELPHPDKKYRSASFDKSYRIIYRIELADDKLYVLDIFHTSRSTNQIKRLKDKD